MASDSNPATSGCRATHRLIVPTEFSPDRIHSCRARHYAPGPFRALSQQGRTPDRAEPAEVLIQCREGNLSRERCFRRSWLVGSGGRPAVAEGAAARSAGRQGSGKTGCGRCRPAPRGLRAGRAGSSPITTSDTSVTCPAGRSSWPALPGSTGRRAPFGEVLCVRRHRLARSVPRPLPRAAQPGAALASRAGVPDRGSGHRFRAEDGGVRRLAARHFPARILPVGEPLPAGGGVRIGTVVVAAVALIAVPNWRQSWRRAWTGPGVSRDLAWGGVCADSVVVAAGSGSA